LPLGQVVALSGNVSLEEAAATPLAGITALNAVEALGLAPGSRIHVNNPLGAVGRFAIQIAKALGLDVAHSPKAGEVDGAVDVRGGASAWETFRTVRDGGAYTTVIPEWWKPGGVYAPARGITPLVVENAPTRSDLARLAAWLAVGNLSPQIEAVLPLADGAEAHRRLEAPGLTRKIILDHGA
jgi:NADPH:quinone reductase